MSIASMHSQHGEGNLHPDKSVASAKLPYMVTPLAG